MSRTLGSSFIIKGTNNDDILAPTQLKETKTLILSGGEGKDTYHLKLADWQNYQTIIIDNQSQDLAIDHLVLPINVKGNSIFVNRFNDNLILTDSINQASLVLHNVYGTNSLAHQHLMIHFDDGVFNISELANEVTVHRGAMYLSSYFEEKPQCNADLAYLAESCSQITQANNVSYQPNEKLGWNTSSSDIIPINTLQSQIH